MDKKVDFLIKRWYTLVNDKLIYMDSDQQIKMLIKNFDINAIYARRVFNLLDKDKSLTEAQSIINTKPKPFVKWVGGKRQLLKQFRSLVLYPPERFDPVINRYFEPFVGGGAVFFDLLPDKAFLSDLNSELITTYNVIKNNVKELIKSLKKHKHTKEYFLKIRALDPKELSDIENASRFIFLNRTCFNGLYRVNSKGGFNVPFGQYKNPLICDEQNLLRVSESLKNVDVVFGDYKWILKKAKKGDFVYFDPPYYPINKTSSFTAYTKESFLDKEQIELRDTFLELHKRGCFVMLSNSNTPFINEIYSKKGIYITEIKANRAINSKSSGRGRITEVLITNYKNEKQ